MSFVTRSHSRFELTSERDFNEEREREREILRDSRPVFRLKIDRDEVQSTYIEYRNEFNRIYRAVARK